MVSDHYDYFEFLFDYLNSHIRNQGIEYLLKKYIIKNKIKKLEFKFIIKRIEFEYLYIN